MTTTFGIKKSQTGETIEVACVTNYVAKWLNPLAQFLPDETKVYPFDGNANGIYTIGDIKEAINYNGKLF